MLRTEFQLKTQRCSRNTTGHEHCGVPPHPSAMVVLRCRPTCTKNSQAYQALNFTNLSIAQWTSKLAASTSDAYRGIHGDDRARARRESFVPYTSSRTDRPICRLQTIVFLLADNPDLLTARETVYSRALGQVRDGSIGDAVELDVCAMFDADDLQVVEAWIVDNGREPRLHERRVVSKARYRVRTLPQLILGFAMRCCGDNTATISFILEGVVAGYRAGCFLLRYLARDGFPLRRSNHFFPSVRNAQDENEGHDDRTDPSFDGGGEGCDRFSEVDLTLKKASPPTILLFPSNFRTSCRPSTLPLSPSCVWHRCRSRAGGRSLCLACVLNRCCFFHPFPCLRRGRNWQKPATQVHGTRRVKWQRHLER